MLKIALVLASLLVIPFVAAYEPKLEPTFDPAIALAGPVVQTDPCAQWCDGIVDCPQGPLYCQPPLQEVPGCRAACCAAFTATMAAEEANLCSACLSTQETLEDDLESCADDYNAGLDFCDQTTQPGPERDACYAAMQD